MENVIHTGCCHCGAVGIEVEAPPKILAHECNCSMCRRVGFLHLIVPAARFRLVRGEDSLADYRFNTGTARHRFCRVCGCKPFYVPRSNPDGFSVNVRCIDPSTISELVVEPFDGSNWEANAAALAELSRG